LIYSEKREEKLGEKKRKDEFLVGRKERSKEIGRQGESVLTQERGGGEFLSLSAGGTRQIQKKGFENDEKKKSWTQRLGKKKKENFALP